MLPLTQIHAVGSLQRRHRFESYEKDFLSPLNHSHIILKCNSIQEKKRLCDIIIIIRCIIRRSGAKILFHRGLHHYLDGSLKGPRVSKTESLESLPNFVEHTCYKLLQLFNKAMSF